MAVVPLEFNPSSFAPVNAADTCSVWNVLSSRKLFAIAIQQGCDFCVTGFVVYECLHKPRRSITDAERELRNTLEKEQSRGRFKTCPLSIADLQRIRLLEARTRLGKGELSTLALAMTLAQAFMSDDDKAQKLAASSAHSPIQSTPHLLAWLVFSGALGDGDKDTVIAQHRASGRNLVRRLEYGYEQALRCRVVT
jgi:hypothetical protein